MDPRSRARSMQLRRVRHAPAGPVPLRSFQAPYTAPSPVPGPGAHAAPQAEARPRPVGNPFGDGGVSYGFGMGLGPAGRSVRGYEPHSWSGAGALSLAIR